MITLSTCPTQRYAGALYPVVRPQALQSFATKTRHSLTLLRTNQISHKTCNNSSSRVKSKTTGEVETGDGKFFDEDGAVKDMDGYLNHLSLEYDSVWDTKPSWCQPWTITLTGVLLITCSWLILRSVIVTSVVSTLIGAWWYIFLYSYPQAYTNMIAERRKNVTSGLEDTYGSRNNCDLEDRKVCNAEFAKRKYLSKQ